MRITTVIFGAAAITSTIAGRPRHSSRNQIDLVPRDVFGEAFEAGEEAIDRFGTATEKTGQALENELSLASSESDSLIPPVAFVPKDSETVVKDLLEQFEKDSVGAAAIEDDLLGQTESKQLLKDASGFTRSTEEDRIIKAIWPTLELADQLELVGALENRDADAKFFEKWWTKLDGTKKAVVAMKVVGLGVTGGLAGFLAYEGVEDALNM